DGLEEAESLVDREPEHLAEVVTLEANLERLVAEAGAAACVAGNLHVGEEAHVHLHRAEPFASVTATALDVEAEPRRLPPSRARLGELGEELAHGVERANGARRRGARVGAERRGVDHDHLLEALETLHLGLA